MLITPCAQNEICKEAVGHMMMCGSVSFDPAIHQIWFPDHSARRHVKKGPVRSDH